MVELPIAAWALDVMRGLANMAMQRQMVTVKIVDARGDIPDGIMVAITNHNYSPQSSVVISDISVHFPAKELSPKLAGYHLHQPMYAASPKEPSVLMRYMRRKFPSSFRIQIQNETCEVLAKSWLSEGGAESSLTLGIESITLGPGEITSRMLPRSGRPNQPQLNVNLAYLTLFPSCTVGKKREVIWGLPAFIGETSESNGGRSKFGGLRLYWPDG